MQENTGLGKGHFMLFIPNDPNWSFPHFPWISVTTFFPTRLHNRASPHSASFNPKEGDTVSL
jgi:hypothetical protein